MNTDNLFYSVVDFNTLVGKLSALLVNFLILTCIVLFNSIIVILSFDSGTNEMFFFMGVVVTLTVVVLLPYAKDMINFIEVKINLVVIELMVLFVWLMRKLNNNSYTDIVIYKKGL